MCGGSFVANLNTFEFRVSTVWRYINPAINQILSSRPSYFLNSEIAITHERIPQDIVTVIYIVSKSWL
jgi:hypothetical protein